MIMGFSTRDVFGGAVIVQQMANTSPYGRPYLRQRLKPLFCKLTEWLKYIIIVLLLGQ